MKKTKKLIALVIAMVMVLAMGATTFAADPTGSITVTPSATVSLDGKTLEAYKILDATYSTDGKVAYTIPDKLTSFYDSYFGKDGKTASELAAEAGKTLDVYVTDIIANYNASDLISFEKAALAAAKNASITKITGTHDGDNIKFSNLEAGYYVIEDTSTKEPISALMLDTVTDKDVVIEIKASDDTKKEIMTAEDLVNSKANELGLGRAVNYKITQKIPNTEGYDYYYYMINDTLSAGLTFDPTSVVVKVGDNVLVKGTDYYLYADKTADAAVLGTKTFIIAFEDVVKDIADEKYAVGDTVTVTYSATVNSNAVVGVDPNNNTANVQYSNDPDKDGRGDFDGHPGIPKNDQDHPTGNGPEKRTNTYSEKITVLKLDGSNEEALPGVEFTLTGTAKDAVFNQEEVFEIDPTGEYWLLKNGTYTKTAPQTVATLQETTGGAGWVEIENGETVAAGVPVRVVNGKNYRPYVKETDSGKTRYVIIEPNDADYASLTTKYAKVTKTSDAAESYSVSRTGITGANGTLDFSQLGAGSYKLSETGVLAGYNAIPDITFTLECKLPDAVIDGTEKAEWTITNVTPSNVEFVKQDGGTFQITILNQKGTELPSTGGIGTTIFYIVGAILVIGAGVLLVTRRRMNAN